MTIHWGKHKIRKGYTMTYWGLGIWARLNLLESRKENTSHWALTVHEVRACKISCPYHTEHFSSSSGESLIIHHCVGPLILSSRSFNPLPREPEIQLLGALLPVELPSYLWTEIGSKVKKEKTSIYSNDSSSKALSNLILATKILFEMLPLSSQFNPTVITFVQGITVLIY